ncbi:hypothetical protein Bbelb_051340 [Branchiostoma belcheri]|nr:hypothetical protein Bbelb_051340 [Branchiostoma belcheri]
MTVCWTVICPKTVRHRRRPLWTDPATSKSGRQNQQLFVVAEDKIHHLLATLNADFASTTQFVAIPLFGFPEGERDASPEPTRVEHFVMDFEDGMWGAIRSVFPNCTREGCAFHLTLAIDNQCITRRGVYELMRKLMVLQFLPAQRIDRALAD